MFRVTRCGSRGVAPFELDGSQREAEGGRPALTRVPAILPLPFPPNFTAPEIEGQPGNQPTNHLPPCFDLGGVFSPAKNSVHLGPMKSQAAANKVGGDVGQVKSDPRRAV